MNKKLSKALQTNRSSQTNAIAGDGGSFSKLSSSASDARQQFAQLVLQGKYDRALHTLHLVGTGIFSENEKAVCLMRLGRFSEAIEILRSNVLKSGCTWMRSDIPLRHKTNFATALSLGGHPNGCIAVLEELNDETIPAVIKVREILKDWEEAMTFWQRLTWHWFGAEPSCKSNLPHGDAGEFETALVEVSQSSAYYSMTSNPPKETCHPGQSLSS